MRTIRSNTIVERVFDFVNLLRKAPRTVDELAELLEAHRNTVVSYVDFACGEGLIEPCGERAKATCGRNPTVYRWVDTNTAPRPQPQAPAAQQPEARHP